MKFNSKNIHILTPRATISF